MLQFHVSTENVPVDVDLRSLAGPVRNGTSKLADVKEDAKDLVIPGECVW